MATPQELWDYTHSKAHDLKEEREGGMMQLGERNRGEGGHGGQGGQGGGVTFVGAWTGAACPQYFPKGPPIAPWHHCSHAQRIAPTASGTNGPPLQPHPPARRTPAHGINKMEAAGTTGVPRRCCPVTSERQTVRAWPNVAGHTPPKKWTRTGARPPLAGNAKGLQRSRVVAKSHRESDKTWPLHRLQLNQQFSDDHAGIVLTLYPWGRV